MIKHTNLRIGNKLQKETGEIFTVSRIDKTNDVLVEEQKGLLTLDYNLYGIPLWKGILEKVGFINEEALWMFDRSIELGHHLRDFYISKYDDTQIKLWNGHNYCGVVHCEFFHELQNICFTLLGFELTIVMKNKNSNTEKAIDNNVLSDT